jgi:hypothetical protein
MDMSNATCPPSELPEVFSQQYGGCRNHRLQPCARKQDRTAENFSGFSGNLMGVLFLSSMLSGFSSAQTRVPAKLMGHAILPANTLLQAPADAPRDVLVSGKFTGVDNQREDRPGTIMGRTAPAPGGRETGLSLPFKGQPVQGFSSMKNAGNGAWWLLTDNGFGNRKNSSDALLMWHRARPDFGSGRVAIETTTFLRDPDGKIPFRITWHDTPERYLTGADLDVESLVMIGETVWLGDEFGPYLIRADLSGRVTGFFETELAGRRLRAPDHHSLQVPATPNATPSEVPRSGGFEGMAATPDGSRIWAMLEKPLLGINGQSEGRFLHVLAFDPAAARWTGTTVKYALEKEAVSIGDLNMIDASRALVIERDDGQGDPGRACGAGSNPPGCFENPARFKRVYVVDFAQVDSNGFAKKLAYIDLMDIEDPENLARQKGDIGEPREGRFTFPFFTIETVAMVDANTIMVGNDNNLPFSAGRFLHRPDDNEFILLHVPELLAGR